jgi:mono/diheme cytochrome c family protein
MTHTKDEALKLLDALRVKYSDVIYDISPHLAAQFENGIAGIEQALAAPTVQEPVAHCEAGPEYCQQCHLEDRSLALAAAVRYVKNNTPKLASDEICMALTTPHAQPAVPDAMTSADIQEHIEYVAGWNDCRAEMLKGMKP